MKRFERLVCFGGLIALALGIFVPWMAEATEPPAKPFRPPPTLQEIVNRSTYIVVGQPVRLVFVDEKSGERFVSAGPNRFRALETIINTWLYPTAHSGEMTVRISTQERFLSDQEITERYMDRKLIFFLEPGAPIDSPRYRADSFVTVLSSKAEPLGRLDEVKSAIRMKMEKGW